MNFLEAFKDKTIRIPLLQRDYVQGGREDVINPFLDAMLNNKECDLNYIYGYDEDGCFVPVDGQQRLITLWLIHLYLYAQKNEIEQFKVNLTFLSREYAQDFCTILKEPEHLDKLLQEKELEFDTLDKAIADQNWFISSWLNNATVCNMLGTLKYLHQKISNDNLSEICDRVINNPNNISFDFLNMKKEGLDDDIYIKMNGRGRMLSAFENLKSWMDEQVSSLPFAERWKIKMDNSWTTLFWKNRNLSQEHPEEIDDEQLFCFYNLLILYHVGRKELADSVDKMKKNFPQYTELLQFMEIADEEISLEDLVSNILKRLQEARVFPLVWIKRLNLMPQDFFESTMNWIETLSGLYQELNSLDIFLGADASDKTTKTYQLSMCESSYDRTLPLFYAVLKYNNCHTTLFDWMRVLRNLILNSTISKESLPRIIEAIDRLNKEVEKKNIYEVLADDNAKDILKGFNLKQISEEILKAKLVDNKKYYEEMIRLENGRFFKGRIGFIFNFLSNQADDNHDELTIDNFHIYVSILLNLFDGSEGGIKTEYDDGKHLLRRALMSFKPYYFGVPIKNGSCWCFCKEMNEWRDYVNGEYNGALRLLIKELLAPAYRNIGYDVTSILHKHIEGFNINYDKEIEIGGENLYRYHFIHYPDVWDYMSTQCCVWKDNDFDIMLKTKNGNNSDKIELRTYCLYLDYKYSIQKDCEGWNIDTYPKEESCFYFDRTVTCSDGTKDIAIDVYFYDNNRKRNSENCYALDLFLRTDFDDKEEEKVGYIQNQQANKDYFSLKFKDLLESCKLKLCKERDGRYHSQLYSKSEIVKILRTILTTIAKHTEMAQ